MDQLREKRVELILAQLEELPTLPAVAVSVLQATASDTSSAREVTDLISSDQALTARVLQLLHRGGSSVSSEINTVDRAVVMLGFEAIRGMVLAVSVFQTFAAPVARTTPSRGNFSRDEFWKHSLAVACCAELLAMQLLEAAKGKSEGQIDPSAAFVAGLIHDVGKVALDAALPKSFDRVIEATDLLRGNIADLERNIIGLDHMVVGKRLAERWGLPTDLRDCIWLHGQIPGALPATVKNARLVNLISLGDSIVRQQHVGYSGNYTTNTPRQALLTAVGADEAMVDRVIEQLVAHISPRAQALGLGQAAADSLYLSALSQANKALGRMSTQLVDKNRRLAVRAKFFDALSQFQSELRPDAGAEQVLRAIGQTAVEVLDASSAGVFSAAPGQAVSQVLLLDHQGEVFAQTVITCPANPTMPPSSDGPVLAVGADLEWLMSAISPRLGGDHRYWICLEADGKCIGGVIWGGRGGEGQRLLAQVQELTALASGWSLALRTSQIREESRLLAEQLAEANRKLNDAQDELQRSKTIVTVGEMAAGAAHEMNNPLAVISGRSQLLAAQLTDPKLKHAAKLIFDQSHRLSEIITELMDFAKPAPPQLAEVDVADIVERSLHEAKFVTDPADRTIEVTLADIPAVCVDAKQVGAALTEVIGNALQATDESKGHITIHAAYDAYTNRVVLTINDNGCGMDEETLKRAFDPFFSSKAAGRRRGMGLAKALRWIEFSGGSIRLESREGKGTRSIILLPGVVADNATVDEEEQKMLRTQG